MLPVVYGTGGPPSSRRRRRATIFLGVVSSALGNIRNVASSSSIIRPASTATIMTTALGLLMILLPAAYPDKISIGECSYRVFSIESPEYSVGMKHAYGRRTANDRGTLRDIAGRTLCNCSNGYGGLLHSSRPVRVYSTLAGSKYSAFLMCSCYGPRESFCT